MADEQDAQSKVQLDAATRRREARRTQTYRVFIRELARLGNIPEELAERAAASVLCALEQRIMPQEAEDLEAQLPQRLQEMLWRCERHEEGAPKKLDLEGFLGLVADDLGLESRQEAEPIVRHVFTAVRTQVSEGEAEDVMNQLPSDLRTLWQRPI